MKKKLIIIGIILAIVIWVISIAIRIKNYSNTIDYDKVLSTQSTIINNVTATGRLEPTSQINVGTQVSGIIDKLYADFNSQVKAGQLIAEIDKITLQADLDAVMASLNNAKIELEYQTINYNRQKTLHEKKLVSDADFEQAEYNYNRAITNYDQIEANVKKAEKNISYATIYSPIDGVVLSRAVDEGQTVAASFETPTLFTIAKDLKEMRIVANVDEADIGQVKVGQSVEFTVDAFPDNIFTGTVQQVRLLAEISSNVVTYKVVIDAPNPDEILMPGLTANVSILTDKAENVIIVPVAALRFSPENYTGTIPTKCVWTIDANGEFSPIEVTTGLTDGVNTEITSGLSEGVEVVIGTLNDIKQDDNAMRFSFN